MTSKITPGLIDAVAVALAIEEARQKGHTMHPTTRITQLFHAKEYRRKAKAALETAAEYQAKLAA